MQKPFLKWAGNKTKLCHKILTVLPSASRLVEPFAGSCALFLNSDFPVYKLCDHNPDLMVLYQSLITHGHEWIAQASAYFQSINNQAAQYYALREKFNSLPYGAERAALFLYLNRHGYNGLCRYNRKGEYNVPFGRYSRPYFPQAELLVFYQRCHQTDVTFETSDFRAVMSQCQTGDVVYCDPPYIPLSASAGFTDYTRGGFSQADQQALLEAAETLAKRKVPVLISNHATAWVHNAYAAAAMTQFPVARFISCLGDRRQSVQEVLALFM